MKIITLICSSLMLFGCTAIPQGVEPVTSFELERYLGTWYEIARLDHPFERGLSRVSAHYSLRTDGGIMVVNRGYDSASGQWKEATGRAYPIAGPQQASLKVSFFRPFYAGYHVIELDQESYSYALVSGPKRDYLWILARTPKLVPEIVQMLVSKAGRLGFDTDSLIFVDHQE